MKLGLKYKGKPEKMTQAQRQVESSELGTFNLKYQPQRRGELLQEYVLKGTDNKTILKVKALSKQEGPNVCWDARFLNFDHLPAAKKVLKKRVSL